jgi:hypothetical protein
MATKVILNQADHTHFPALSYSYNIDRMFKRFHDKSHNMSRAPPAQTLTYQQISKSKSALKSKYMERHKHRVEVSE